MRVHAARRTLKHFKESELKKCFPLALDPVGAVVQILSALTEVDAFFFIRLLRPLNYFWLGVAPILLLLYQIL